MELLLLLLLRLRLLLLMLLRGKIGQGDHIPGTELLQDIPVASENGSVASSAPIVAIIPVRQTAAASMATAGAARHVADARRTQRAQRLRRRVAALNDGRRVRIGGGVAAAHRRGRTGPIAYGQRIGQLGIQHTIRLRVVCVQRVVLQALGRFVTLTAVTLVALAHSVEHRTISFQFTNR